MKQALTKTVCHKREFPNTKLSSYTLYQYIYHLARIIFTTTYNCKAYPHNITGSPCKDKYLTLLVVFRHVVRFTFCCTHRIEIPMYRTLPDNG